MQRGRGKRGGGRGSDNSRRENIKSSSMALATHGGFHKKSEQQAARRAAGYAKRVLGASTLAGTDSHVEDVTAYQVMITGLPIAALSNVLPLVEFLRSKLDRPVTITNSKVLNNKLFFTVANEGDARSLELLSPLTYNNERITIKSASTTIRRVNISRIGVLEKSFAALVAATYDVQNRMMDLSNIKGKISGVEVDFNESGTIAALWRVLQRKCAQVESVTFANNGIHALYGFAQASSCRSLINFSFLNNSIADLEQLDHMRHIKVKELDLRNNQVTIHPKYKTEMGRKFPTLRFLDGQEVGLLCSFDVPSYITTGAVEIPPSNPVFFESQEIKSFVVTFMAKYFKLFDDARDKLLDAYTDDSNFSLTIGDPCRVTVIRNLIKYNRNLLKRQELDERVKLLSSGRLNISKLLAELPKTVHNLNVCAIDAYSLRSGVSAVPIAVIHIMGPLMLGDEKVGFDRVLMLAPPSARSEGWPGVIVNDQLQLFDAPLQFAQLQPQQPPTPATSPQPPAVASPSPSVPQSHLVMAERLVQETRLQAQYAVQCLEAAGWNYDAALVSFQQKQAAGQIPPQVLIS
eukprot:TRINITY_DN7418_c0_g1_i1.p1 TRINITY_DN7418_c0_g1~~TRINITY_DN7418_c0_g1_i1.p1  ORF type:complete len:576 (+),score=181.92 TRINITY_DN7418_c0_g1_i1:40-1767(+)